MIRILIVWFHVAMILGTQACQTKSKAQKIIDNAIDAHGGEAYKKAKVSFDFREIHYKIMKTPSRFEYSREFQDTVGYVLDFLNNDGFSRSIDGRKVKLTQEREAAYARSVNAVAYFAFLPYGLNDAAAQKMWVGESNLEGNTYDIIKVSFSKEGGGDDFDDEFLYWINRDTDQVDFLAYSYQTDGGGLRFRKAINKRMIKGILMQDYFNYKPSDENTPLEEMESQYLNEDLELLSTIELENIQVEFLE